MIELEGVQLDERTYSVTARPVQRGRSLPGAANPAAKLSEAQVSEIKAPPA